jgi:DNA ligase D-like protein (predicted 3'-phosphoesterase)
MSENNLTGTAEGLKPFSFVIQEHFARTHHFDFRLEKDGVFKSWAVPKGVPTEVGVKRLAVQVEDHPLEWVGFEGEIPPGEYGAGTVNVWDRGIYDIKEWEPDRISFVLHGEKLQGRYELVRFRRAGEREWLIFRLLD